MRSQLVQQVLALVIGQQLFGAADVFGGFGDGLHRLDSNPLD
jgi:hypothetical protein